ncbi:acetyltransferase [Oleiphilus sp. HI0081]|nr:acetyltransferase [Oleiphilus sp. HI0072]KZZ10237.1 acetyltransferase [Oleiphilus sp. HI0078]KZZ20247.1 acetyltransferase [Oleiphilus sp. HI0081]
MREIYAVYGASGYGREVMPLVRQQYAQNDSNSQLFVFIDDNPTLNEVNSHKVYSYSEFLKLDVNRKNVAVAIANDEVREKLSIQCVEDGIHLLDVTASNVINMDDVSIDKGYILSPFVTLTSNIKIGKSFHANIYSYVAHDCVIGDYVTFAPGVKCNGNVHIEDHAYIGTGAILKQGTPNKPLVIGARAIIGMGAVVTKDVPPNTTVVGNPAKPFNKK